MSKIAEKPSGYADQNIKGFEPQFNMKSSSNLISFWHKLESFGRMQTWIFLHFIL